MLGRGDPDDELLALYALDALEGDERAAVEAAVAASPALAERLEYHRTTAAALGASVPVEPPPDLRQRVLAAAFAESAPRSVPSADAPSVVVNLESRRRRLPTWRLAMITTAAAGLLVALVVAFGGQEEQSASAVLVGPAGTLAVVADEDRILLSGTDLEPLASDQTYELWLVDADGTVESAGVFAPASDGTIEAELPGGIGDASSLAVSLEPAGGSPDPARPSGPVEFSADLIG